MKICKRHSTGANRANGERNQNLRSLCFLLFKSGREDGTDFKFLARDKVPTYADNPESFRGKPELREYKSVFVENAQEVSQFGDKITANWGFAIGAGAARDRVSPAAFASLAKLAESPQRPASSTTVLTVF
jgi:hypothetical protein